MRCEMKRGAAARSNAKREGGKNDKQTKSLFKKPGNEDGTNHADWQGNHHTGTYRIGRTGIRGKRIN